MDILLLGAAAIVLIALTVWIVWRPDTAVQTQEASSMLPPQGNRFEDQYTSATADLSAGGVAVTAAGEQEPPPMPLPDQAPIGRKTADTLAAEAPQALPSGMQPALPAPAQTAHAPIKIGLGAAAALTVAGAAAGAWLYARWQKERNKPINRLRRTFK